MRKFTWFLWCLVPGLGADPDGLDLIRRAVEAERANRIRAGNYLFREVIYYSEAGRSGEMTLRRSNSYEVTFLEGEPFHRLVAVDGRPLTAEAEAREAKRMEEVARYRRKTPLEERRKKLIAAEGKRFRIDLRLVSEQHIATLSGPDTLDGRLAWIVDTQPKPGVRRPKNRGEWALAQKCRYWIDQETYHPLKLDCMQLYDWDSVAEGARTVSTWTRVDEVWLVSGIRSTNIVEEAGVGVQSETDQVYSNYRKFGSTSAITYEAPR